ncbi:hypothetical protein HQ584_01635 [Patescibacteria group bacterium]|nr:hypothetical protein [Patescibacteria group bacterium]
MKRTKLPLVNQDIRTGIVVPSRNPKALAEAMNTLLKSPTLEKNMENV